MIKIEFSAEDRERLDYERYHHPHPRVQRKMEALWLKSQDLSHQEICRLTGISKGTLCRYLKEYQQGGIEKLKETNFHKPKSKLAQHTSTIEAYFRQYPPATIKEAAAKIEELTGIKRSETQVRKFLHSIGMKCRKVGMVPAKADPEKQAEFKKEKLDPVLEEAKAGTKKVFFVDAAHFVLTPFLGYLWSFCRLFIKAPAGRKRFNVLGALDAITHELTIITNDSYINAETVCDLLKKLRHLYPDIPVTLVLDNARYQKCKVVWELAASLNIELLYIPPYSPNFNLIERLWKFVKKQCLYSKYYADFDTFKTAISDCLAHTHDTHKEALDALLTLNFQTFDTVKKVQFVTL
ncbi:MAG: IS630 family transposase [Gammaproteobacteria bacterium]|nr:IS630 family transposase [Gammaproteobacteria bacterium]